MWSLGRCWRADLGGELVHRLKIHNLGPIQDCEINCSGFMTFTGFQASGKSTLAKSIFYFRTIKDDLLSIAEEIAIDEYNLHYKSGKTALRKRLIEHLREKFLRVFGSSYGMDNDMVLEYHFTEQCFIIVSLRENQYYDVPNYVWVSLSRELCDFLDAWSGKLSATPLGVSEAGKKGFQAELEKFFEDACGVIYIPAGRSLLTLLSQQLSSIYASLKDFQKRTLDYCTQDYIERILAIKPVFSEGLRGILADYGPRCGADKEVLDYAYGNIQKVLKGQYLFSNGEERIFIGERKYVKINFASSGQQEAVWILNLIFYYLSKNKKMLFIIEEPESHLFPESQKFMTELIALAGNVGNDVVVTTHSPYVLGTLNNLLYASQVKDVAGVSGVIPRCYWLERAHFDALFVRDGRVESCMNDEIQLIQNEKIDEISKVINKEMDASFY